MVSARRLVDRSQMSVRELKREVHRLDEAREALIEDPMTEASGAPVEDFFEQWDREERALLVRVMRLSERGSFDWEWAVSRLERFLP